jgi:CelD/BcsL family acetyltransferase involved in cellulose biosynthesis
MLTCRVLTTLDEWRTLAPVWDSLLDASPDHTPWQSFDFLTGWWQHLSNRMLLRIYVVERDGVPALVLPLQISYWRGIPFLPTRILEPVSMVMDVNRPRLALGAFDADAYRCAFDALFARRSEWDLIRIDEKPWDDAEIYRLRDYALGKSWVFRQAFSHLVPYLDLRQNWSDFLKTRSQKMRKNLKAAQRKLEERGTVSLRSYETAEEVRQGFEVLLALHARSWKHKDGVEHSKAPGYSSFYSNWVQAMGARGHCRVLALFCDDEPVAATIAFVDRDTYYSAQIVHDAKYSACSPGTLLESMELEKLMTEQRYAKYDLLGSFLSNKLRWTDTATNTAHVLVFQRRLRTFVMDGYYYFLKPHLRPVVVAAYNKLFARKPAAAGKIT